MNSPFKFLDSYTLADKAVFFGREEESDVLYKMAYKSGLILLYGMSGTGKTSLIQCGLASKFNGPDWYPIWIRRNRDINESLREELSKASNGRSVADLLKSVSYLYRYYLRPIYLIFDQFEELFISGGPQEQDFFMQDIQVLLSSGLPVKIIFVMREEYLGQLYHFEQLVPHLFDQRLRVEPMSQKQVKAVMEKSFEQFNIELKGDKDERLDEILENISGNRSLIQLPYLQVYLDKLYQEDFVRTYGNQERNTNEFPALEFTKEEISDFGKIDDVLERFLDEQVTEIQGGLGKQYPELAENAVSLVINQFVTEDGTKKPIYYTFKNDAYTFERKIYEALPAIPEDAINQTIETLEANRLLRYTDNSIELAHDTLGLVIDRKRTEEQRQLNTVLRQIKVAYNAFPRTGEHLSRKQLNYYDPYLPKLKFDLSDDLQQFITNSRDVVEAVEQEEKQRIERELALAEDKLKAEKAAQAAQAKQLAEAQRARRRQRIFLILVSIIAVAAIIAGVLAIQARQAVNERNREILEGSYANNISTAESLRNTRNFGPALAQLDSAATNAVEIGKADSLALLTQQWQAMFALVDQADSLRADGDLYQARLKLNEAVDMDTSFVLIRTEYKNLQTKIDQEYNDLMSSASSQEALLGGMNPIICDLYQKASRLKPNDTAVLDKLRACQ